LTRRGGELGAEKGGGRVLRSKRSSGEAAKESALTG